MNLRADLTSVCVRAEKNSWEPICPLFFKNGTKSSKLQFLICLTNISLQNDEKIHNQSIYNYTCADVSCKEDVFFARLPPPSIEGDLNAECMMGWPVMTHSERVK